MNSAMKVIIGSLVAMLLLGGIYAFSTMDFTPTREESAVEREVEISLESEEEAVKEAVEVYSSIQMKPVFDLKWALVEAGSDEAGKVVLDARVRNRFNEFCNLYWMQFMPNVDNYEFEYLGAAVWHMFFIQDGESGQFQERMPALQVEQSLQELYLNSEKKTIPLEHRSYKKYVVYEDGYYSLVPQGYNANTFVYEPLEIKAAREGETLLVKATMNEYTMDTAGHYEAMAQEIILKDQAAKMGLTLDTALTVLLESNQMDLFEANRTMEIEFLIDTNNTPHIIRFYNGEETYRLD